MYPFSQGVFAARNQWYVAAWSHEVGRALLERWVLNEPVVLYRTESGSPVAVAGRCPHRHFPLGKGRLIGDTVQCGYHGFTFASDGRCVHIPSQSAIPSSCRIQAYPLVERWQWLWIWMGDPALADESLIPDHQKIGLEDSDFLAVPCFYFDVSGRYQLLNDNLLDLSHLGYLHQTSIGTEEIAEASEQRTEGEHWIGTRRKFHNALCPPFFAEVFRYEGRIDREFGLDFLMPGLHVGFDEFCRVGTDANHPGTHLGRINVYHAVTPGKLRTTNYFFALGRNFAKTEAMTQEILPGLQAVLREDVFATEAIEALLQNLSEVPHEFHVRGDAHSAKGRRLLEALIQQEQVSTLARTA